MGSQQTGGRAPGNVGSLCTGRQVVLPELTVHVAQRRPGALVPAHHWPRGVHWRLPSPLAIRLAARIRRAAAAKQQRLLDLHTPGSCVRLLAAVYQAQPLIQGARLLITTSQNSGTPEQTRQRFLFMQKPNNNPKMSCNIVEGVGFFLHAVILVMEPLQHQGVHAYL